MPTITEQTAYLATNKTLRALGANKAVAWLDQVMAATAGSNSGEDALSVLNRKLEAAGVLATGTNDPVFANESALLYVNTTNSKLFVRGTSAYTEITGGTAESDIIGHGTTDEDTASASDPWIYINTNANKVWLKERTGSPGSYSYAWTGPIFEGNYRILIIYSTQDEPGNVTATWNWKTDTLGHVGTDWTGNSTGAKWARIITAPRNSNNAVISARFPVGSAGFVDNMIVGLGPTTPTFNTAHSAAAPLLFYNTSTAELWMKTRSEYRQITLTAGDIGYDRRNTDSVLGSAIDTVEDAINVLSDQIATLLARPTGGGTGTDDQTASEVPTSTANFNQNLSASDNNVQLALNTIDNLDVPPYYQERFPHTNNRLESSTSEYTQNFTIPQRVRDYRDRKGVPLSIVANSHIEVTVTTGSNEFVEFSYEVLDATGNALTPPIISTTNRLEAGNQIIRRDISITGILPDTMNAGRLRTRVTSISAVPPGAGVEYDDIQVVPDPSGIDASRFSGNLSTATNTLQKFANAVDVLTIIGSRYEQRVVFTGGNVNSATPTNLGRINISNSLRNEAALELGYPIKITAGFEVNGTIASGVEGRLYISNGTGISDLDYGGINLNSNNADNSQLIFEATLPPEDGEPTSTNVPSTVYVMLRRDAGTTAIAVDNGVVFLERDEANQILNQHQDRFDFNSGERYEDELARNFPSTSQYTINVPQSLLDVRTNEARAIRAVVRANLSFQSTGSTNIDFQIRDTAGTVLTPDVDIDENVSRTDTNSFNIETSFELPSTVTGLRLELTKGTGSGEPNVSFNYFDGFFQITEPNALTAQEVLTNTDAPGWSSPLTAASNNVQLALEQLAANTSSSIDASGFDGNLATTDDTLQEVAQKFDDYNPTAGATTVVSNDFSDPDNYIGGLREVTGISGVPNTPANVQQALVKTDYLLQEAFNPFQSTQLLDRSVGGGFSSAFSVNNATPVYSNPVDIPEELRALGTDIAVRVRVEITALGSGFAGDIRLVDPDNRSTVFYGAPEVVNTSLYSSSSPNNFVTFQRTIPAASVPDTFEVRFQRTDGGTTTSTFDNGFADVIDSTASVMGGAGGQASSYTSTIIWLAGASIYDRLTVASETTNYTLMSGHQFTDYDQLVFVFDGGSGSTQPLVPCWVDANLFQSFGAAGTLWIVGNWWLMVSRQSTTTFRFRWRAPSNGLRRIIGIKTN